MLILALVVLAISVFLYWYLITPLNHWKKRGIPYVKGLPIVGNFFWHALKQTSLGEDLQKIYKTYPDKKFYGMFMFRRPTLIVRDLEMAKNVLIKHFEYFADHSDALIFRGTNPTVNRNLFSMLGDDWRDMRSTLSPAFTGSKMRGMFQLINECGEQLANYFMNEIKNKNITTPLNVELKDHITRFSNDVIATTAFGLKIDSLRDRNNEFYRIGGLISKFSTWRFILCNFLPHVARFLRIGSYPNEPVDYLRKIALETIKIRERDNIYRPDILQLLIEAKNGSLKHDDSKYEINKSFAAVEESKVIQTNKKLKNLDDDDLAGQVFIFFLAGYDSSSNGACFALYELAINPDIQERLYLENEKILNENNGKLTYDVLNKMKYLDMILSESLRKWTSTFIDRICVKPYTVELENGQKITLEKGTILTFPIYAIQHDAQYYPDPDKFDPERFSDENKHKINPLTYLSFGAGPRNCIGSRFALMEIKTAIFYMVKYFELVPNEKSMIPPKCSVKRVFNTLDGGFHISLKLRKNCDIK